ncbi:MAG TPA: hypothetical protein VEW48_16500 [Thermoanaerobaculia bacterium]|nr:hypothetical protein [Thermoanaerobaculia bacterium]
MVDEPTELPEGTEIDLLPLDPGDWLDFADRAALERALIASQEDIEAGRLIEAEDVLRELRTLQTPLLEFFQRSLLAELDLDRDRSPVR